MIEEEIWGILTKEQFGYFLSEFTRRFGNPVKSRRLSFSFWDHTRNQIDIRIRITNGNPEIMLKVGTWEDTDAWVRSEQRINLQADSDEVFTAYQILRTLIPGEDDCYIYQSTSYIFKTLDFEIKLTHQSGKSDKYPFEVEKVTPAVDLNKILIDLNLSDKVTVTDTEFWDKWNQELNLKDKELNKEQIIDLIKKYLVRDLANL